MKFSEDELTLVRDALRTVLEDHQALLGSWLDDGEKEQISKLIAKIEGVEK